MCDWKPDFDGLNERVTKIEGRMSQVEHDVGKMRAETQDGFKQGAESMRQINTSVSNLAHDFGERMTNLDKRIIEADFLKLPLDGPEVFDGQPFALIGNYPYKMRSETQDGFRQGAETMRAIDTSLANLAHDFGERMNGIDRRLVEEKQKWGDTLRWAVKLAVRVLIAGAALAMGITAWNNFVK